MAILWMAVLWMAVLWMVALWTTRITGRSEGVASATPGGWAGLRVVLGEVNWGSGVRIGAGGVVAWGNAPAAACAGGPRTVLVRVEREGPCRSLRCSRRGVPRRRRGR